MQRLMLALPASVLIVTALLTACAPSPPAAPATSAPAAPPPAASSAPAPAAAAVAPAAVAPTTAPVALAPVRMGTQTSVNDIAMWLGTERGYFKEEGVDLDLVPFSNASEMVPSLATDQIEAGGIAFNPATINAVARGVSLKAVLDRATFRPGFATQAMVVRKAVYEAGRGRTLGELRGLTVSVLPPGKGTGSACALDAGMRKFGATINDIDIQQLTAPDMLGAFINGQVDAGLLQEPFLTEALRQGSGVRIMGQDEMYPNFTLGVTAFSVKLYENRSLAKAVVRGYIRASRAYNDAVSGRTPPSDRAQIDALLARYTKIDEATVREMTPTGVSPNGVINVESQAFCHRFFVDEGLVPQPLTEAQLAAVFATDLLDEVLSEMGRVPEGA